MKKKGVCLLKTEKNKIKSKMQSPINLLRKRKTPSNRKLTNPPPPRHSLPFRCADDALVVAAQIRSF